jgi:ADP-ribose pyrophosphatase
VVCVVPVDTEGNILFVRQMRPVSKFSLLELPAGHIEPTENPEAAAMREMGEETGFDGTNLIRLGSFFTSPGWCTEFAYCFLVTGLSKSALVPDEDEEIELVRVPVVEIMGMIERGELIDSKAIAALLLALPRLITCYCLYEDVLDG